MASLAYQISWKSTSQLKSYYWGIQTHRQTDDTIILLSCFGKANKGLSNLSQLLIHIALWRVCSKGITSLAEKGIILMTVQMRPRSHLAVWNGFMKTIRVTFGSESVDLQRALPYWNLSCGPLFCKLKVWTYNYNIHICLSDQGYMFMWDEAFADWGSYIINVFETLPRNWTQIVAL
jgi:hypothetical protein